MSALTTTDLALALSGETLVQLTDDDRDGFADEAVVAEALAGAEREIRDRTGMADGSPLVGARRDDAVALAVERLFHRRRQTLPSEWAIRAAGARQRLHRLPHGTATNRTPDDRATRPGNLNRY
ncbi:MAG: hypothetical protein RLY93_05815 [Sumerlaeia bacterium]